MKLNSEMIKEAAENLRCDLCGIASIDRFDGLPAMSNPKDILESANSVIVIAKKFLNSSINPNSTIPYTIIRNHLSRKIDEITVELSYYIESHDSIAVPTGAIEPCNYNKDLMKSVGLVSLKNAAHLAGLGVIGKNTLLITPQYGNMVWLGAVITSLELKPDPVLENSPCNENCKICISNCPIKAIDGGKFMDQEKCWNYAFGESDNGEWRIKCYNCRRMCPFTKGYK